MKYELYHHGIKGQRWGVRRYQNPDGTLSEAGRRRVERYKMQAAKSSDKQDYSKAAKYYLKAGRIKGQKDSEVLQSIQYRSTMAKRDAANIAKFDLEDPKSHVEDDDYLVNVLRNEADRDRRIAQAMSKQIVTISSKGPKIDGLTFDKWIEREEVYSNRYLKEYDKKYNPDIYRDLWEFGTYD